MTVVTNWYAWMTLCVQNVYSTHNGLPNAQVSAIHRSAAGLWVGTWGGGATQLVNGAWIAYPADCASRNHIWTIRTDDKDTLWFGTWGGGVMRLPHSASTYEVETFSHERANYVWACAVQPDMTLGTSGGLLIQTDGRWRRVTRKDGLAGTSIRSLAHDGQGHLWIGHRKAGLSVLDGGWQANPLPGLAGATIPCLLVDRANRLWIGTWGQGVFCRDGDGAFTHIPLDGLGSPLINGLTEDAHGHIWAATWGGGVSRWDGTRWTSLTTTDGLPHNRVFCVVADGIGVWCGTFDGLALIQNSIP